MSFFAGGGTDVYTPNLWHYKKHYSTKYKQAITQLTGFKIEVGIGNRIQLKQRKRLSNILICIWQHIIRTLEYI